VRREVSLAGGFPPLWREENQLRELSGGQPRETAAIADPTKGQAPIAFKTVPAEVGDLERFAAHGLHGVPEERRYLADLDGHVRCRPIGAERTPRAPARHKNRLPGNGTEWITSPRPPAIARA
jgi:hypothetical protein